MAIESSFVQPAIPKFDGAHGEFLALQGILELGEE